MVSIQTVQTGPGAVLRHVWRLDVSDALPGDERLEIAAGLVLPADDTPKALLVCLPGGFLTRRYYDLEVDADRSFSFAQYMAGRGFATLSLDHLGVGESSRPADGWALDVECVARANQLALDAAESRWRDEVGPTLPSIGVGHSMGSCLSVVQQANHAPNRALVLFSFTTLGLRPYLQGRETDFADDPDAARSELRALARERFGSPFPGDEMDGAHAAFSVGSAPPVAERALHGAATCILPIPALLTMFPGGYVPWAERVRVPVLAVVGDNDLHRVDASIACLPNAASVDTYTLEDSWHCHNVANTRTRLWDHVAQWTDGVLQTSD